MNMRQAKKIFRQKKTSETHPKSRSYWYKYHKAESYISKLYNNRKRRLKKKDEWVSLSNEEIDEIINNIMSEFNS